MSWTARLVDAEGVTWDELEVECFYPQLRVPLPIKRPMQPGESFATATFTYERTDGGGVRIYRLAVH